MHVIIVIIFIISWLCNLRKPDGKGNVFGNTIKPFYQISGGIWSVFSRLSEQHNYFLRLKDRLMILHPNKDGKELIKQYICYKTSLVLVILFAANLVSFVMVMQEGKEEGAVNQLARDSYWGMEREELLQMEVEGTGKKEDLRITVSEQKYEKEEIPKILEKMAESLEKSILKSNQSLDCVTSDLNLVNEIEGTQVEVNWSMEPEHYLQYNGAWIPGAVTEAGAVVNLTATLIYEEELYMHTFAVHLQKPQLSEEEQMKETLQKEIETRNVSTAGTKVLKLPEQVKGKKVSFHYPAVRYGYKILMALLCFAVIFFFMKDEELQKEMEKRKKQMLVDYSEVVSKLTLLLGAGLTIRSALEKIAADYDKKRQEGKYEKRFAYDEILYVCREMQGGISERLGIDMLGKRCQIPCYMKLCSLLLQNLKKGSKGMAEMLSYEVGQAFEERKNLAKRFGEEAGTKLLFPMILMLVIVMVVLIIPAFLSF